MNAAYYSIIVSTFVLSTKINYLLLKKSRNYDNIKLDIMHTVFHIFYNLSDENKHKKLKLTLE